MLSGEASSIPAEELSYQRVSDDETNDNKTSSFLQEKDLKLFSPPHYSGW